MNEIIKKTYKKSNIIANSEYDFYKLTRKSCDFLDCNIERINDDIIFEFIVNNEKPFTMVRNLNLESKYQSLINIQGLYEEFCNLNISLIPENIYCDINMLPKIMMRDVNSEQVDKENEFLKQYKALIGFVLQNKYTYEDYYQGGNKLLSKNKYTEAFVEVNSFNEIMEKLNEEYKKVKEKIDNTIIEVDKRKYKNMRITNRVCIVLLSILIIASGYFGVFRLNEEITFNEANRKYITQDYISVLNILNKTKVSRMNKNEKYILAVSTIKTESLTEEQKNNILSSVTLNADDRILEFWIYLGKNDMAQAIDIAKQLGNKEYLAYGYMKEKSIVENDKSLSGTEREEKLKTIEDNLKNIDILNDK